MLLVFIEMISINEKGLRQKNTCSLIDSEVDGLYVILPVKKLMLYGEKEIFILQKDEAKDDGHYRG